jgi:hypothetical protein
VCYCRSRVLLRLELSFYGTRGRRRGEGCDRRTVDDRYDDAVPHSRLSESRAQTDVTASFPHFRVGIKYPARLFPSLFAHYLVVLIVPKEPQTDPNPTEFSTSPQPPYPIVDNPNHQHSTPNLSPNPSPGPNPNNMHIYNYIYDNSNNCPWAASRIQF